jgi:hypothetical protein
MPLRKDMQSPKVTEINRLSAHAAATFRPSEGSQASTTAPRLGAWPSNPPQSSSTAGGSAT